MTNDPDSDSVKEARERAAKFLYSSVTTNPLYQNKDVDESTESRGEQMERAMARNREWVKTQPNIDPVSASRLHTVEEANEMVIELYLAAAMALTGKYPPSDLQFKVSERYQKAADLLRRLIIGG